MRNRAVFLDRDGTLMEEVHYCREPEMVRVFPGAPAALRAVQDAGFHLVIITNQSGIGRGLISVAEYEQVHATLLRALFPAEIARSYYCPAVPGDNDPRRKPAPGMVLEAAQDLDIDLAGSWFVGDKAVDVVCGKQAGTRTIRVQTGYGACAEGPAPDFLAKEIVEAARIILTHAA